MQTSVRRMLEGVFDYAGLFPPAKLDMQTSLSNYIRYRSGPGSWILNRFICSSARLTELAEVLRQQKPSSVVNVSVVGQASTDYNTWGDALEHDAKAMTLFQDEADGWAEIEAYEVRVPEHSALPQCIADANAFNSIDVFLELPWDQAMVSSLALIAESEWLGAKARTGGLEPSAFPSSEQLAEFLIACSDLDLTFKLTAGLHHPIRSDRDEVGCKMHGFLNIITGVALHHAQDLTKSEMTEILEAEDPARFRFEDTSVWYKDLSCGIEQVDAAREVLLGIGSCSIEEPLEDLATLKLM